jgi:hypothetical protein
MIWEEEMSPEPFQPQTAWVISADMGLGHQRAAFPLKDLSEGLIITAGLLEYATIKENKLWKHMRQLYEGISRINQVPVLGKLLFGMLEQLESISPFYPFRDLSKPNFQTRYLASLIHKGLGQTLINGLQSSGLPIVSTFFAPAIAADKMNYPKVYLIATDTDINRVWVAEQPLTSKIIYCVPCSHTLKRLKEYGVPDERIFLTGFPLPKENLGSPDLEILKSDLAQRLQCLDPNRRFRTLHQIETEYYLHSDNFLKKPDRILSLTFAVGGAGAQKEIGAAILKSLKSRIQKHQIQVNLVAGIRSEIYQYFLAFVKKLELENELGSGVKILRSETQEKYFREFNQLLRTTDILWTKPSELSFYCGLGIPIIISPPLGSQERYNQHWLTELQAGIPQEDPSLCSEWLFDLLNEGRLAQTAWDGFLNARKCGTYKIEEIVTTGEMTRDPSPLKR